MKGIAGSRERAGAGDCAAGDCYRSYRIGIGAEVEGTSRDYHGGAVGQCVCGVAERESSGIDGGSAGVGV